MEKPICVLGLDISSSKIGIAVLDQNKNIITSEVLKLSSDLSLEERGLMLENKLIKLNKHYYINDVFIDKQPYLSWNLDSNFEWQPPVARPQNNNYYKWNEQALSWDLIEVI